MAITEIRTPALEAYAAQEALRFLIAADAPQHLVIAQADVAELTLIRAAAYEGRTPDETDLASISAVRDAALLVIETEDHLN